MNIPVKLEECSWKDVQAALVEGYDTVIIPSGSIEQHGPHLPILTDALIGEVLGEQIAARLGKAFSAPVIRPGLSEHHMAFPGSLTLTPDTFQRVLAEYCLALARHGFRYLVLISSHGGNFEAIEQGSAGIQAQIRENGLPAVVIPYVDLEKYVRIQQDILVEQFGGRAEEASGHADVVETAMMLAIRPDLVKMSQAEPGWMGDLFTVKDQLFKEGLQAITANGILGDPRRATEAMGRQVLELTVQEMAADIRSLIAAQRDSRGPA